MQYMPKEMQSAHRKMQFAFYPYAVSTGLVFVTGTLSVGNPRDQMTKYTEFATIFSSASGRICKNIHTEWNLFK